jgi:hypothetical protein
MGTLVGSDVGGLVGSVAGGAVGTAGMTDGLYGRPTCRR